ncbi:MAG: nitroreductase family protein [Chloroflexaceae bacterium]|nr:nitroreductase family protein [Chloroflexaceae bacterium]
MPTPVYDDAHLLDLIQDRRSVRVYQRQPVAPAQIERLLEAARWAPSPHNAQPWRFVVIVNGATPHPQAVALADAMAARWREELARDGQDEPIINHRLARSRQRLLESPVLIIPCLDPAAIDRYPDPQRQSAEMTMAIQSIGSAIQNMLLMARAMGLDSGWMCAPLFCPDVVCTVLSLDPQLQPQALITIGYAIERPVPRARHDLAELVVYYI